TGEVSVAWETDSEGRIQATWSDGAVCGFPAGRTVREARCGCPAAELCRHIIRTVLAWQNRPSEAAMAAERSGVPGDSPSDSSPAAVPESGGPSPATAPPPAFMASAAPWNPGTIAESHLEEHSPKGLMTKARLTWERGALVECVTGVKPWARFYDLGLTVRFPVPGDVRYAHCDCGQPGPCLHALLAVFAFRRLPKEDKAALVASGSLEAKADLSLLTQAETIVEELTGDGIASIPKPVAERWKRCAAALHGDGLIWLAGIVQDLLLELERYQNRDALFSPDQPAFLAGELLIRCDALRRATGIPRGLAGGWKSSEKTEVGYSRWIGLGSLVTTHRKSVTLGAYLQEAGSGSLGVVTREVADPGDGETDPGDFAALARAGLVKGAGIRQLGSGQVLTESCRRTPDNRLAFGRARAQVSTQAYEWENLRAPVLVGDFAELRARLSLLPPRSLRPRRDGEDFHVLPIDSNTAPVFDPATQLITATLRDTTGGTAQLRLPWTARGEAGCEAVLRRLTENGTLFVSGQVGLSPAGLTINPAAIILRGEPRVMLQPWVDETPMADSVNPVEPRGLSGLPHPKTDSGALPASWQTCGGLLMDWLVTGKHHQAASAQDAWRRLREESAARGSHTAAAVAADMLQALHALREGHDAAAGPAVARALTVWRSAVDLG
ncbi:MAG: hypothetical protein EOP86_17175, partial [Verrucomicrobiaceae bacterium]